MVLSLWAITAIADPIASGVLRLPGKLSGNAKNLRTIFISIHDARTQSPMPCAAKKLVLEKDAVGDFLSFKLETHTITMMACPSIPELMNLKAKLDQDGSAGRDQPGDIVGFLKAVKKGSRKLTLTLDKLVE